MKFRLFFILSFFTLLYFAAILNIYGLQVKRGDYYMALALSQQRLAGFLEPLRGNIYFTDRNSKPVEAAITRAFPSIFSVPMEIDNPESAALVLAPNGILNGRRATCYPGFEKNFSAEVNFSHERVIVDGHVITSRGPGSALEFALQLVETLAGKEKAESLSQILLAKA